MTAKRATFRQADLTRAVKAARAAGLDVARIEINPDGTIVLEQSRETISGQASPLDQWKAKRDARPA
ncbi:hypothetical protein ACVWZA_003590 [Sphingomonas sp. UYAg733]